MITKHCHKYLEVSVVDIFKYQRWCPRLHMHTNTLMQLIHYWVLIWESWIYITAIITKYWSISDNITKALHKHFTYFTQSWLRKTLEMLMLSHAGPSLHSYWHQSSVSIKFRILWSAKTRGASHKCSLFDSASVIIITPLTSWPNNIRMSLIHFSAMQTSQHHQMLWQHDKSNYKTNKMKESVYT